MDEALILGIDLENQNWFIFQEGHHRGPFSLKQMKKFLRQGSVKEQTKVWRFGQNHWKNLAQYEEFKKVFPTLPLSEPDLPPPITAEMFESKVDTLPSIEDVVATRLMPEQKVELKKELKQELKNEIKREIKPEMEPQIRAEFLNRKKDLKDELKKDMASKVKAEVIDHRVRLKKELKKEIKSEIKPEMKPDIRSELINQREFIKDDLKKELAPRIKAEVNFLEKKTENTFKNRLLKTVDNIESKISKTVEGIDVKIKGSIEQVGGKLNNTAKKLDSKIIGKVQELDETIVEAKNHSLDIAELREKMSRPSEDRFERPQIQIPENQQVRSNTSWFKSIATFVAVIPLAFIAIYFFIYIPSLEFERPLGMPDKLNKKFEQVTSEDLLVGLRKTAGFSFAGDKIFFASNMAGEGNYEISIKSVPGRVLSTTPIKAVGKGYYQKKLAIFNRFTMLEGKKFVPGEYEVSIVAESFERSKTLIDLFSDARYKAPALKTTIIWKGKDPKNYDDKLSKFLDKIGEKRRLVLEEIQQKYMTQVGLLNQMQGVLKEAIGKRKPRKTFKSFYIREVGPILSSISLKNREAMAKVSLKDPYLYKEFEAQLELGKSIGLLATDIIGKLNKNNYKQIDKFFERLLKLKEDIFLKTYEKPKE